MHRTAKPDGQIIVDAARGAQVNTPVAGNQHGNLAVEVAQRGGQRTYDIGEAACFRERRGLGGNHQNFDHGRGILIMTERTGARRESNA